MTWAGPFGTNDGAADVAITTDGHVVVTGHSWHPEEHENAVTILYHQSEATTAPLMAPADGIAVTARRNPFSARTSLRCRLPRSGPYRLAVHDLRGRRVRLLETGRGAVSSRVTLIR